MFGEVIGENRDVMDAVDLAQHISASESPVLICGEPGSGKELLARVIHRNSLQKSLPFVVVDCTTLTDVTQDDPACCLNREGPIFPEASLWKCVQAAEGGTLYLKNIETLPLDVQKTIVRFLGCETNHPIKILLGGCAVPRVIASMTAMVDSTEPGRIFDRGFWELIAQFIIKMPPLRERGDDLILLAQHFVRHHGNNRTQGAVLLSDSFLQSLRAHDWPGNIRELKETVVRASASARRENGQPKLQVQDASKRGRKVIQSAVPLLALGLSLREAKARAIEQFERQYLSRLMSLHGGNVSVAARSAGTERRTFQRLLHKYGLKRDNFLKSA